jgi:integrase
VVAKYRNERIANGLKPDTVRNDLALLSHLFTIAIREWGLGLIENPVKAIKKPSPGPGRERRLSHYEDSRLSAQVAAYSNPMLRWIYEIAIESAMRKSEITGLEVGHVDVRRRFARPINTKNGETRTVPLSRRAAAIFAEAIANPMRPKNCSLIFPGEPGRDGVRKPYNFNKAWREARDTCEIVDLRFQDLRHEGVSRLVEGGLSDQEVSAISGHKTMQMLKRYSHLRTVNLIEKLDRIRDGDGEKRDAPRIAAPNSGLESDQSSAD